MGLNPIQAAQLLSTSSGAADLTWRLVFSFCLLRVFFAAQPLFLSEGLSAFIVYSGIEVPSKSGQFGGVLEDILFCLPSLLGSLQSGMFQSQSKLLHLQNNIPLGWVRKKVLASTALKPPFATFRSPVLTLVVVVLSGQGFEITAW